jgi:hypothetical protein
MEKAEPEWAYRPHAAARALHFWQTRRVVGRHGERLAYTQISAERSSLPPIATPLEAGKKPSVGVVP